MLNAGKTHAPAASRSGRASNNVAKQWQSVRSATKTPDPSDYKTLVDSLFSSAGSIIQGGIAAILTPLMCWYESGHDVLLMLAAVMTLVVGLRLITFFRYRRVSAQSLRYHDLKRWDREFFAGATLQSFLLGLTVFAALMYTTSAAAHITSVGSAIGFASGFVARNSGRPGFVILQLFAITGPMEFALFASGHTAYAAMGGFLLLFFANNIAMTFSVYRNLLALSEATKTSQKLAGDLHLQNVTLDAALNHMTHGLAMFDAKMILQIANPRFADIFGLPADFVVPGITVNDLRATLVRTGRMSSENARELTRTSILVYGSKREETVEIALTDQRTLFLTVVPASDGGLQVLAEDITERKAAAARIERMAHFDELTQLANRFTLNNRLELACSELALLQKPFAVHYIDLDNFKIINDSQGHEFGDKLLVAVSDRLTGVLSEGDFAARFGGDEFILVQGIRNVDDANTFADRVLVAIGEPILIDGKLTHVSCSVGIAVAPDDGTEPTELLRHADMALYQAKGAGRSAARRFSAELADAALERHELEKDLRGAARRGELEMHYQPVVDLANSEPVGFEALMRWKHPVRGMVPPMRFIPIAEQTGLIDVLGAWALEQACRDAMQWPDHITVAVNVSPLQFRQPVGLINAVKAAIERSGIGPNRLTIEVTESLLIENQEQTLETIRTIRQLGVRFSLDDFGTGYSSLSYLSRYPFAQVKIDRSFVIALDESSASRAIVESVCLLARKLGMQTVVEGVETELQRQIICELGADRAQGYLFGRPQPAIVTKQLIRSAA
jgi:diguanylate cyclase (GGDEF)-like protein